MQVSIGDGKHLDVKVMGVGTPLVLLHAFPLSKMMWRPQLEALSSEATLIAVDLRGFGASSPWDEDVPGIDAMADDVAKLLEAMGIQERVVLAGVSMGGYVALSFAERHRKKALGLILSNTRAEADDDAAKEGRAKSLARLAAGEGQAFKEELLARMTAAKTKQERPLVMAELRAIASVQSDVAVERAIVALRDRPDRRALLRTLMVPSMVIAGREDLLSPVPVLEGLAKGLPNAELVVVDGAGHLPNLEAPDVWNRSALRLLKRVTQGQSN
jgi:pimeloyl-ACP methyl ester carboxylesterase